MDFEKMAREWADQYNGLLQAKDTEDLAQLLLRVDREATERAAKIADRDVRVYENASKIFDEENMPSSAYTSSMIVDALKNLAAAIREQK